jgi:hypothetical protein
VDPKESRGHEKTELRLQPRPLAQDRRVLDFCDRNGILMQEEVPAWGWETFHDTSDEVQHALEQNGLEQMREMVRA